MLDIEFDKQAMAKKWTTSGFVLNLSYSFLFIITRLVTLNFKNYH